MLAEVNWTAILGAGSAGVVVTAVTNYILQARKFSGDIGKSDADKLWAEARSIRDDQTAQLQLLRTELEECKRIGDDLRRRISDLEDKLKGAR